MFSLKNLARKGLKSCLTQNWISTCDVSVLRNDVNCNYIFKFSQIIAQSMGNMFSQVIKDYLFWCWKQNIPRERGKHNDCWCPGSLHSQVFSSRNIDWEIIYR